MYFFRKNPFRRGMFMLDWFLKLYQQETDSCEIFSGQQHGIIGQYEFGSNKDLGLSSQFCDL